MWQIDGGAIGAFLRRKINVVDENIDKMRLGKKLWKILFKENCSLTWKILFRQERYDERDNVKIQNESLRQSQWHQPILVEYSFRKTN